jgi:hypothetical protein
MRPYLEKTLHKKRTCGVAQVVGTELNSSTTKKKKKEGLLDWCCDSNGRVPAS